MKNWKAMKGLWIVLLDIISIVGLTVAAYAQRSYYTIGGEAFLIGGILAVSMGLLGDKPACAKQRRAVRETEPTPVCLRKNVRKMEIAKNGLCKAA